MLIFVLVFYKNQKMCNKAVDNYTHYALEFVPLIAIRLKNVQ